MRWDRVALVVAIMLILFLGFLKLQDTWELERLRERAQSSDAYIVESTSQIETLRLLLESTNRRLAELGAETVVVPPPQVTVLVPPSMTTTTGTRSTRPRPTTAPTTPTTTTTPPTTGLPPICVFGAIGLCIG